MVFILLKDLTRENLLTMSVSGIAGAKKDIFVLDGNEAATAGIAEMLVQSHDGYIEFLPALPKEWKTGYYKGLCVRDGGITDVAWKNGAIKRAMLKATTNNIFNIKVPVYAKSKFFLNGKAYKVESKEGEIACISLNRNDMLEIQYR